MVEGIDEFIRERSVSVRAVLELIVEEAGAAVDFFGKAMLSCISMQNMIKIYHAVQELWAFSLTDHCRPAGCSAKPSTRFAYQFPDIVTMYSEPL